MYVLHTCEANTFTYSSVICQNIHGVELSGTNNSLYNSVHKYHKMAIANAHNRYTESGRKAS